MTAVRVLIVADDPLARAGLAALLNDLEAVTVVGRVAGTDDLDAAMAAHRPDVLLWDRGWNAQSRLTRLTEARLDAPIVVLAAAEEDARQGWLAGIQGLLRRDAAPDLIAVALRAVAEGLVVVDATYRSVLAAPQQPAAPWLHEEEPVLREELTRARARSAATAGQGPPE